MDRGAVGIRRSSGLVNCSNMVMFMAGGVSLICRFGVVVLWV